MADYKEEQEDEMEALESIFVEDYKCINDVASGHPEFEISLWPEEGGEDESDNFVGAVLNCAYPPTYPEVVPRIKIRALKGLSAPEVEQLLTVANNAARDEVGCPGLFAITEEIKEWLREHNEDKGDGSAFAQMQLRAKRAADQKAKEQRAREEAERAEAAASISAADIKKQQEGTALTVERFNKWNETFLAEVRAARGLNKTTKKQTGREIFEKAQLASSTAGLKILQDEHDSAAAAATAAAPSIGDIPAVVDESLFLDGGDLDDEDLDDLGFDD